MGGKTRLDHLLVARGLARNGSQAQALVLAGEVSVDGQVISKPGTRIHTNARLEVRERPPFVSRGGAKLVAALDAFGVSVRDAVCADVGASTGGFTDCLLQRGAARVYAIDVGYGQLAWKLRQDRRVVVMERTNARYVEKLPSLVQMATIDASFISLNRLLPAVTRWLAPKAHVIPLVKPQFEARREQVGKRGVVRDPVVHRQVLEDVADHAARCGLSVCGLVRSPIVGPAGNIEFLLHLRQQASKEGFDLSEAIARCVPGGATGCPQPG